VAPEPFKVEIADEELADLRARLARTRLPPDPWDDRDGTVDVAALVRHWRDEFDWRSAERDLNELRHFRTTVQAQPLHFVHERGRGPAPLPIVLTHGWPWTFWDFRRMIRPLADPAAFGGDPDDAFDVVVPSLPGYGFSTPLTSGVSGHEVADLWVELMAELGYDRFAAHGGDWGALVTAQLGHKHPGRIAGIHLSPRPYRLDSFNVDRPWAGLLAGQVPGDAEALAAYLDYERSRVRHVVVNMLGAQIFGYGFNDSPAGLAAWIAERRWGPTETGIDRAAGIDDLLTTISIYWFTQSAASAARLYAETWRKGWQPSHEGPRVVDVPTGVTLLRGDLPPGALVDWIPDYYDLRFLNELEGGGHFAPLERPEQLVDDLRAFFRPLR
jgi:pimeloyl-ACP methyl ester carboxylesterase